MCFRWFGGVGGVCGARVGGHDGWVMSDVMFPVCAAVLSARDADRTVARWGRGVVWCRAAAVVLLCVIAVQVWRMPLSPSGALVTVAMLLSAVCLLWWSAYRLRRAVVRADEARVVFDRAVLAVVRAEDAADQAAAFAAVPGLAGSSYALSAARCWVTSVRLFGAVSWTVAQFGDRAALRAVPSLLRYPSLARRHPAVRRRALLLELAWVEGEWCVTPSTPVQASAFRAREQRGCVDEFAAAVAASDPDVLAVAEQLAREDVEGRASWDDLVGVAAALRR
jgi:hypothetical protein